MDADVGVVLVGIVTILGLAFIQICIVNPIANYAARKTEEGVNESLSDQNRRYDETWPR